MKTMELTALNITQAADMLAKKEISSAELTQAYIDRICLLYTSDAADE